MIRNSSRMTARTRMRRAALAVVLAMVAALGATACNDGRWCEHDATDTVVEDRYCHDGVPGHEWETPKKSSKPKKSTPPSPVAPTKSK
ncbi:hypothetical protein [Nocardia asiatica]|uniref:hypothetical protein n=1 Tax=Nocardia asiatica TaxID=209252 RepID=UPI0003021795|nr:hypothetical protein [Nocardia asiatica]